ncbi:MAG: hypothetical protein M1832_002750 [Thelocarpon impressellum]|nr:MAG: hypothetical protein M1832_002750 [Thelocarpon impressellum]
MPASPDDRSLWVYNSLGRKKDRFVPLDARGKKVTWYCCGPTVYDAGHLGHARNYVTTDILRRVLQDYFGYEVEFVMNITDVDDKIILRARQQHLLAAFREKHDPVDEEAAEIARAAYSAYLTKNLPRLPGSVEPTSYEQEVTTAYGPILEGKATVSGEGVPGDAEAKVKMHHKTLQAASKALAAAQTGTSPAATEFYAGTGDILLPHLDGLHGSSIRSDDYGIFTKLTQHWERRFREDLRMLNCLPPTIITRVSEFSEEIIAFVRRIEEKGFAYVTSDGSVYFDIAAFEAAGNTYARLEPWNRNDKALQADGEGSLTKKNAEKKADADFVLWKASKPGEPSWPSPWGQGRPGWHIECSAMASEVLGGRIDIHSGGIDLAFPHHDNELAQSEAYWTQGKADGPDHGHQHDWIKYFLHMGHLSIQGSKMSKSLKNFTTIDDALTKKGGWTSRSLRIVFLLGGWKERIEVTDDVVSRAGAWDATVANFFANVKALAAEQAELEEAGTQVPQLFRAAERELRKELEAAQTGVDDALRDSFNTPAAMALIEGLITKANVYIGKRKTSNNSVAMLEEVARWIARMTRIFGLEDSTSASTASPTATTTTADTTPAEAVGPFIRGVSRYRDAIRQTAMAHADVRAELLALSDALRDNEFVSVGISLDDRDAGQPALVKAVPVADLLAQRAAKRAEVALAERRRLDARAERDRAERERLERGRLSQADMFRHDDDFSAWDADGVPTRDAAGEELSKSRVKKLRKEWERQKRAHEAWLASGAGAGAGGDGGGGAGGAATAGGKG